MNNVPPDGKMPWDIQRLPNPPRFPSTPSIKAAASVVLAAAVIGTVVGGFYTVQPTEIAGIRRLGMVVTAEPVGPGLHFKLPDTWDADEDVEPRLQLGIVRVIPRRWRRSGARPGSLLYLPRYSPDLNAIEQVFAKLKAVLRGAATRTKEALWTTIGQLLNRFSPAECRNYLTNSRYEFT